MQNFDLREFVTRLNTSYVPKLNHKYTLMENSKKHAENIKVLNTEIKGINEDILKVMQDQKLSCVMCEENMYLCVCVSKRKQTFNQTQIIETCTKYITEVFLAELEKHIWTQTKQTFNIRIHKPQDIQIGIENSINTARSTPMVEKTELKFKKQRPPGAL